MDMESGLIGMICFLNESKKHQTTFVWFFVYRHFGLLVCNISLMKNYLKLSNIIIVLLFICWELKAQVALPTFQPFLTPHKSTVGPVIAANLYSAGAILANGTVKFWGWNNYGGLGQGNTTTIGDNSGEMGDNLSAIDLGTGRTAVAIGAGRYSAMVILDNGMVINWGHNNNGQLGLGHRNNIGDGSNEYILHSLFKAAIGIE